MNELAEIEHLPTREWFSIKQLQELYVDWWSIDTVRRVVGKMERHKDFRRFVKRPTGRSAIVSYKGFMEYLEWMDKNKFRGGVKQ